MFSCRFRNCFFCVFSVCTLTVFIYARTVISFLMLFPTLQMRLLYFFLCVLLLLLLLFLLLLISSSTTTTTTTTTTRRLRLRLRRLQLRLLLERQGLNNLHKEITCNFSTMGGDGTASPFWRSDDIYIRTSHTNIQLLAATGPLKENHAMKYTCPCWSVFLWTKQSKKLKKYKNRV